ncbi:hypothetical protein V8E53_000759 [Lactarius tabidus]
MELALITIDEENIYPIFMEFLSTAWGPLGFGAFTPPGCLPRLKLRCGVDAVPAVDIMKQLPDPETILSNSDVITAFQGLYFQAQNQAKAAHEGDYTMAEDGIWWILVVGPYWTPTKFGPFSEAELGVRYKLSDSADSGERMGRVDAMNSPPPTLTELYLLSTPESYNRLEEIIASTDTLAKPLYDQYCDAAGVKLKSSKVTVE